jgi:hypothetical protein
LDALRSADPSAAGEAFDHHIRSRVDLRERLWSSEAASETALGVRKTTQPKKVRSKSKN